ncbi:hypothetical protein WJX74_000868 [Apatococcus lobatus]|uniref:BZIP domain-containing protein n=1 Tax=Apatococcus lobatus TaxID=904363 RepID=A0AAW1PRI7_9CHLO
MRPAGTSPADGTPSQENSVTKELDSGFRPYEALRRRSGSQEQVRSRSRQDNPHESPPPYQQAPTSDPLFEHFSAGHTGQDIPMPGPTSHIPRAGLPGILPPLPVLDPFFQQQRLNLGLPPLSTYSLQNLTPQQQQQQQLYMQSLPQMHLSHPPTAGLPMHRRHPLAPSFPEVGPYRAAGMNLGYPHMPSSSPVGQLPEFNANPGPGLGYGGYPGMRAMFPSFSGVPPGQEVAWNTNMALPSAPSPFLRDQQQQQQDLMTGMQNFAMEESRDEAPHCSGGSPPEGQTLERTGSMPDQAVSVRESGCQSSAARKRKVEQSTLSMTSAQGPGVQGRDEDVAVGTSKSSAEDEGMEHGDDDGTGINSQGRVQRRLAQNREAARKSRQRRKNYVNDLESEVRALRAQGNPQERLPFFRMPHANRLRAQIASVPEGADRGIKQPANRKGRLMPHEPEGSASAFTSQSMPQTVCLPQQAGPTPPYDDNLHGALHLTGPSATAAGAGSRSDRTALTLPQLSLGALQTMPQLTTDMQGGSLQTTGSHFAPLSSLHQLDASQLPQPLMSMMVDPAQQGHQATAIVSAFSRWRLEHALVAVRVREALNTNAPDTIIRALVDEARGQLWALFAMKKTLLASEDATIVMWCSHQPPAERMLGWLGGFRPSFICSGLLRKLGQELHEPGRTKLEALRESLFQQEGMLAHGFEELSSGLLLTAASQALRLDNGQLMDQSCWASPDTFGKLDTLRVTLQRADQILEHMLEQTEQILPLRQHAVAVISLAETSVTLESLQNPWLNLLFRAPVSQSSAVVAAAPPASS